MAFQPIIDLDQREIWGYEALVRGIDGQGAGTILAQVTEENRYAFDQACRVKAIELAGARLPPSSSAKLSINFLPNAVYEPRACISASLNAAARANFDPRRLMFEFTEQERISDIAHIQRIIAEYRKIGFTTALDDFGSGYSGLGLLANFQTDLIKLDMELIRDITVSPARQAIVAGVLGIARRLGIEVLAEGVETEGELLVLHSLGIRLYQGYLFARPQIEQFADAASIQYLHAAGQGRA
jgi:EAL domain-containing protein (putative c-di-GMP-specific phosphodiesterase class I)